ncbi:hypothetical protein E5AUHO_45140 [Citrobacter freundii]|nr:hypothetical protein E5AUHO_45140 [Citrobacter freundii]
MSERRYSPLATLFAATFLFRIGNAVAALALPWFVLSHTKSAAWAGATAASSVIATIIGAWVGGGLVDHCSLTIYQTICVGTRRYGFLTSQDEK